MTENERHKEAIKELSQVIKHQTWLGDFWGRQGALALNKVRNVYVKKLNLEREYLSDQSSLYYSAKGNAEARALANKLFAPYWLLISHRCFNQAVYFSDQLAYEKNLGEMANSELIVRSTVMKSAYRFDDAQLCIDIARGRDSLSAFNKVLLSIDEADMLAAQDKINEANTLYKETLDYAKSSLLGLNNPSTYVHLCKAYARFLIKYEPKALQAIYSEAKKLLEEAKEIAIKEGLVDQVKKIIALQTEAYK